MITPFNLYLLTRLDDIKGLSIILLIFTIAGLFISIFMIDELEGELILKNKIRYISLLLLAMGFFISVVLLPTTNDLLIIYGIPELLNNEVLTSEAKEVYQLLKDYMK